MPVTSRSSLSLSDMVSREELSRRIEERQDKLTGDIDRLPLTISIEIDELNLLRWLHCCDRSPRFYWSSRDGNTEIAGYGSALRIETTHPDTYVKQCFDTVERVIELSDDDSAAFLGGCRFDSESGAQKQWDLFPNAQFTLPEVSIQRKGNDYLACFAVSVESDSIVEQVWSRLESAVAGLNLRAGDAAQSDYSVTSRVDIPDPAGWASTINSYLDMIRSHRVDKIVAARRTDFEFARPVDPGVFLEELLSLNRSSFGFMMEPKRGHAFVGASPERLFRLREGRIESEALSGTAARGETVTENGSTGRELLASDKNLREHRFVIDDIMTRMNALCSGRIDREDLSLMKLSNVMHIHAKLSGAIRADVSVGDIISQLHPTPAVGGVPRETALDVIREHERFDRGWYAAPVGVIRKNFAEMTVGIRSALVVDKRLSLYAGAGIVEGSEAHSEWMELEHKIAPALRLLGGVLV